MSMLLVHLGVPVRIVQAYMAMLKSFRRALCMCGSISDFRSSTTGVPEGCNLAVTAMIEAAIAASYPTILDMARIKQGEGESQN